MHNNTFTTDKQRRRFLGASLTGLGFACVGNLLISQNAHARGGSPIKAGPTETPKLPENDPQASALGYKEDASLVDTANYKIQSGASCRNCQLYSGTEKDEWGPCAVFSYRVDPRTNRNYVVSAKGWCRSWGPRAG